MIQQFSDLTGVYSPTQRSYLEAVMYGSIPGAGSFSTNGEYTTIGVVTNFPVCSLGAVNVPVSTGVRMSFTGGAQDSPSGTGIGYIAVTHIRADYTEQVEIVTLNATTPVLSSVTDTVFINDVVTYSHYTAYPPNNTTGFASADITVSNAGTNYAIILSGRRRQFSAYKMIPKGKVFIPQLIVTSSVSGSGGTAKFYIVFRSTTSPYFVPTNGIGMEDATSVIDLKYGRPITAGTIMGVEATTSKACIITASLIGHTETL